MARRKHFVSPRPQQKNGIHPQTTAHERFEWIKDRFRENPNLSINGKEGAQALLADVFGVHAREAELVKIKQEVVDELLSKPDAPPPPPAAPMKKTQPPSLNVPPPPSRSVENDAPKEKDLRPGTTVSRSDVGIRMQYVRRLFEDDPSLSYREVRQKVRAAYGVGLSAPLIKEVKESLSLPRRRKTRHSPNVPPAPTPGAPGSIKKTSHQAANSMLQEQQSAIQVALEMLLEEVPDLVELHYVKGEQVQFRVQTTRSGHIKL